MNRRHFVKSGLVLGLASILPASGGVLGKQAATPQDDEGQAGFSGLFSQNVDALPTADEGEAQVVLQSAPLGRYAGFLIHNNSDSSIGYKGMKGIARDSEGALVGVLDTDLGAPYEIAPGEYCLGYAGFDKELDASTDLELTPEFEAVGAGWIGYVDLTVSEISVSDDRVIGLVENLTSSNASSLSHVIGIFLDDQGEIVGVTRTYVDGSSVDAGRFATFSTRIDGGHMTDTCLFASSGWEA